MLGLLNRSVYVAQNYDVAFPTPDVLCHLKSLAEQAEAFFEVQEKLRHKTFTELPSDVVDRVVLELGRHATDENSADRNLEEFRELSLEDQTSRWADWMAQNPFQTQLDRELDAFVPPAFRRQPQIPKQFCFEDAVSGRPPPDVVQSS